MLGLTGLEAYIFIFNLMGENKKFELHKFPDSKIGGVSYEKVKDDIERDLKFSDITATGLQDEIIAPNFIEEYREQVTTRMKKGKKMDTLTIYNRSIFQDFESFLGTEVDLVKEDISLVLDEFKISFKT